MSLGFPSSPLERVYAPLVLAIVVGVSVLFSARQRGTGYPRLYGIGVGLITLLVSVVSLWLAIFFSLGVYLIVRR